MRVEFKIEGKPVPLQRARVNSKTGTIYTPRRSKQFEKLVHLSAKQAGLRKIKNSEYVSIEALFVSKTAFKGDIDNYLKAVFDGLRHFFNDNRVFDVWARKRKPEKGEGEYSIISVGYIVFDRPKRRGR